MHFFMAALLTVTVALGSPCCAFAQNHSQIHSQIQHSNDSLERVATTRLGAMADDTNKVRLLTDLAFQYYSTNSRKANEYATSALTLAQKLGDKVGVSRALNITGLVYYTNGAMKQALDFYQRALAIANEIHEPKRRAATLNNIGILYMDQGRYEESLRYLKESLIADDETGDEQGKATGMSNVGRTLNSMNKPAEALEYLLPAIAISRKFHDSVGIVSCLVNISDSRRIQREFAAAEALADEALGIAKRNGYTQYLRDSYKSLAETNAAQGRFEAAYTLRGFYAAAQDSLRSGEQFQKIAKLQAEHETEEKNRQIQLLTKDQDFQRHVRWLLLSASLLLVLVLVAGVSRYRLKVRSEHKLQATNAEILRQQEILEDQAREIEIANTSLQEKNLLLEQLDSEKNEFLGIAAHDLKNPLAQITILVTTIQRYYDRMTDADIQRQLESIGKASTRMTEIINNLLDVNAIERGGVRLQVERLNLAPLLEAAVENYAAHAAEKRIVLLKDMPDEAYALADKAVVEQVLDNLISNAVKYSPQEKNIFIRLQASTEAVRVEIQDEGPGISDDDQKKLFGKFARLSARPTGGEHSTGLGLSIVKKMVEAMNGRVWCESELGRGATFVVELPTA
jgi:signal transduction histidine kinase